MAGAIALLSATAASAQQLGALISPGRLARAHASLEGIGNCARCHEAGRKVTASRCLTCHQPIADRIARKTGVHRAVTTDCVSCHVEHAGVDGQLRRIDTATFNHASETGYALDGLHARTAGTCAACHKTRSFLEARRACSSCHSDPHKGTLGTECTKCHSTKVAFKEASMQFDHGRARFALTGAHRTVACAKCHVSGVFRGLAFASCSACHKEPHRKKLGPACTSCHTTERWSTREVDHTKTAFPLTGAHAQVACARCHTSGSMTKVVRFEQCSSCHANVHRQSIKEDCRACHTETSFHVASFDHTTRTAFPLVGKHEGLACRQCHNDISAADVPLARKVVDFGGAKAECAACHADPHKSAYGRTCDLCHRPATFNVAGFKHPRAPEFFADRHAGVACVRCHVPSANAPPARVESVASRPRSKAPSMECVACHADVHLGQVERACERCHAIAAPKFAAARFSHDRSGFPLTGKHLAIPCVKCHRTETRAFPAGTGTAMRLRPLAKECRACHEDPHLGQVDTRCETCHLTATFTKLSYKHSGMEDFFNGFHGALPCRSCHKLERGQFPAGRGLAVRLKVGRTCAACHPQF